MNFKYQIGVADFTYGFSKKDNFFEKTLPELQIKNPDFFKNSET